MYTLSQIQTAINNPVLALREANSLYHTRSGFVNRNPRGENFFDCDWDNLIILDACRYDTFEKYISDFDIEGVLSSKETLGTNTAEFVQASLHKRDFSDTVYVTASSMLYRETVIESNVVPQFYDIVDLWENSSSDGVVSPKTVTKRSIEAYESHPSKRIAIHFIQPHTPFIGEFGQSQFEDGDHAIWNEKLTGECDISDEIIWKAYQENLEIALNQVESLINAIPGKTVITSDHGQAIGDKARPIPYPEYGHPSKMYIKSLTKVPWFVCTSEERRDITKGHSHKGYPNQNKTKEDSMHDQLAALGYK